MKTGIKRNYDLKSTKPDREFAAPRLAYAPPRPRRFKLRIGLIGCGGITKSHLEAYRTAGWPVVALCDVKEAAALERQAAFFPEAAVFTDYRELLAREDINVVDVALHPEPRAKVMEAALKAGKHVLSQKPFVEDLEVGQRLVRLADKLKLKLAVNQNGRWAPYARYIYQAIRSGLLGDVQTVSMSLNWDHTWIRGTAFEHVHHVVLYDFAIHWFDMAAMLFEGREAQRAFAANAFAPDQVLKPPMIGSALVEFAGGMAALSFDAHSKFGPQERICVTGSKGTIHAGGPICLAHDLTLHTSRGFAKPRLVGKWFNDGFQGTMGELLAAIEQDREPLNAARENLRSLGICFAALRSIQTGRAHRPGSVPRLPSTPSLT